MKRTDTSGKELPARIMYENESLGDWAMFFFLEGSNLVGKQDPDVTLAQKPANWHPRQLVYKYIHLY